MFHRLLFAYQRRVIDFFRERVYNVSYGERLIKPFPRLLTILEVD